jgi:hypothetical protein
MAGSVQKKKKAIAIHARYLPGGITRPDSVLVISLNRIKLLRGEINTSQPLMLR